MIRVDAEKDSAYARLTHRYLLAVMEAAWRPDWPGSHRRLWELLGEAFAALDARRGLQ